MAKIELIKKMNRLVFPLVGNQFLSMLGGLVLVGITGHISSQALLVTGSIDGLIYGLMGILGAGTLAYLVIASRLPKENTLLGLDYFKSLLLLNFLLGIGFGGLMFISGSWFLNFVYRFQGKLLQLATDYLMILSGELLVTLTIFSLTNRLKVSQRTGVIFQVGIVSVGLQILVTLILLPLFDGNQKVLALAWGQLSSEVVTALVYSWVLRRDLRSLLYIKSRQKALLLKKSLTFLFQELLEGSLFQVLVIQRLTGLGGVSFAAYQLCKYLAEICLLPMLLYCNGMLVLLGASWDQHEDEVLLKRIPLVTLGLILGCFFLLSISILAAKSTFLGLLSDLPEVVKKASLFLGWVLLAEASRPFYEVAKYTLQALGGEKVVLWITIAVNTVALILLWGQPPHLGRILFITTVSDLVAAMCFTGKLRQKACVQS